MKNTLSLARVLVWRHNNVFLYVKTRVLRLIFRVLDVPKGLRARPHQKGRLWALKHEVLRPCVRRFVYVYTGLCMHTHSSNGLTSNYSI